MRGGWPQSDAVDPEALLSFDWNPFQAARSYAREEDLLTDLVGRHGRLPRTAPRWLRMDLALRATLMQDAGIPMPEPKVLARWSKTVDTKLDKLLPHDASFRGGRLVAIKGWRGEVEVESRCAPDGRLLLNRVEVSAYQVVNPPRVFDDPDRRERVKPIEKQLGDLARRFKRAFDAWMGCVGELRKSLDLPSIH